MRKFLLLLAFLVLAAIGLVWAGIVDLNWNGDSGTPVEVKINPLEVGTQNTTMPVPVVGTEQRQVQTPTLRVKDGEAQPAQPQPQQPANGQ